MAKSRRTEKQKLQKEYESFCQEESVQEQLETDSWKDYLKMKAAYERLVAIQKEKEAQKKRESDAFFNDFMYCWPDYKY